MKKFLAFLLPLCLVLTTITAFAEAAFPDLPEDHWAYSAVEKMRNDGRVNGFPDGEFKPDLLVTRWQFAKMAGGNPDLMTNPDRPATRDEAAEYLWDRAGKPAEFAPGVVTEESSYPEAVAWAYSRGVMKGDDGLNLRLHSTLTRAEAATMIVRAEGELGYAHFKTTVSDTLLKRIWDNMHTGISYHQMQTITGGELSRLALQIGYGKEMPSYQLMKAEPSFGGEYAKDVQLVAEECLGMEKATETFMNNPVSVQDAVAVLTFYAMKQSAEPLRFGASADYTDVGVTSREASMGLKFARHNNIFLYAEPKLNAEAQATLQDVAALLLQLDETIGLSRSYGDVHGVQFSKSLTSYPWNAEDYAYVIDEVPAFIYETPIVDGKRPIDSYEFGKTFANTFEAFLNQISATFPASVKAKWVYWPSLAVEGDQENVIRVGLKVISNPDRLTIGQLLPQNTFGDAENNLVVEDLSSVLYIVDISTGTPVMDVVLDGSRYKAIRAFVGRG